MPPFAPVDKTALLGHHEVVLLQVLLLRVKITVDFAFVVAV